MPEDALTRLSVQAKVPDEAARVIRADESVTVLSPESRTVTTGWVVKATPLTAPAGWVMTSSLAAAPVARVNISVVELVRSAADAVSVYSPLVPVIVQPAKVATPEAAFTGLSVQASVPSPDATAKVTGTFESETVLPLASRTVTTGWVEKAAPLTAPLGWVVVASLVAAPGSKVTGTVPVAEDIVASVAVNVVAPAANVVKVPGEATPSTKVTAEDGYDGVCPVGPSTSPLQLIVSAPV